MMDKLFDGVSIVAVLGALGGGVAWTWKALTGWTEKRSADIGAREEKLTQAQEKRFAEVAIELTAMRAEVAALRSKLSAQHTAIHILVVKVMRDEPDATELRMVERLLGDEYPQFWDAILGGGE